MNQPSPALSSIPRFIAAAFAQIVRRRKTILIVLTPMLLLVIYATVVHLGFQIDRRWVPRWGPSFWVTVDIFLYMVVGNIAAVSMARILLLDDIARQRWFGVRWQRREWRTLWRTIVVLLASIAATIPVVVAVWIVLGREYIEAGARTNYLTEFAVSLAYTAAGCLATGRFGLSIIAAAIDEKLSFGDSWRATYGRTFLVSGALIVTMIPYTVMQSYISVFWQSDRAFELRVVGTLLLFLLFLVVQTAVLCEAYRHLMMKRRHADVVGSFGDMIIP